MKKAQFGVVQLVHLVRGRAADAREQRAHFVSLAYKLLILATSFLGVTSFFDHNY